VFEKYTLIRVYVEPTFKLFFSVYRFSPPPDGMNLETAVDHCREAINLFFDNKFLEARFIMEQW